MKKLLLIISALFFSTALLAETKPSGLKPSDITGTVGVAKIIAHPALDAIEKGLQDELQELGFTNIKFDLQSANGEIATASSIAQKFRQENVKVAVGIATPMALTLANNLKSTPIVFSAVTDPIDAGLRSNELKEDTNITGVSDKNPVSDQIRLLQRITGAKSIGFIYNSGEANSIVIYEGLKKICKELGIKLEATTVTNTSEVIQAARMITRKKVDAIYVSTDNVVAAAMNSVTSTALKSNIPVIGADPVTSAGTGALAAYGVDYYNAGRQTGKLIARILMGENPGDIPVKYMQGPDELTLYLDKDVAKKLKINIPKDLLKQVK